MIFTTVAAREKGAKETSQSFLFFLIVYANAAVQDEAA